MALSVRFLDSVSSPLGDGVATVDVKNLTGIDDLEEGELCVVWQIGDAAGIEDTELEPPSGDEGWTERALWEHVNEVINKVWTKLAGPSEPDSYTFRYGTGNSDGSLVALAVKGTVGTPTFDINGTANGNSTSIGAPSVNIDAGELSDITAAVLRFWILYPRGSTGRSISEPGINIIMNDLNDDDFNISSIGWSHIADGASGSSTATASHAHIWTGHTMSIIEIGSEPDEVLKNASIDALLKAQLDEVFSLDALLQAEFTTTYSVDALITATTFLDFGVDATLQAAGTKDFSLDATIFGTISPEFSLDAFLTRSLEEIFRLDAVLSVTSDLEFSLDGTIFRGSQFSLDAELFLPSDIDLGFGALASRWYFGNPRV